MRLHLLQAPPAGIPLSTFWVNPEPLARQQRGGAKRHRLASQSQLHSGAEWRATHDGRRCLASRTSKKHDIWQSLKATGGNWGRESALRTEGVSSLYGLGSRIALWGDPLPFFAFREKAHLVIKGLFGCDPVSLTLHQMQESAVAPDPWKGAKEEQRTWCGISCF